MKLKQVSIIVGGLVLSCASYASNKESWETFSDVGAYGLVGIAAAVPLYKGDWEGFKQAGFSIGAASGVGLIAKNTIDAERPDGSDNKSFPSNHTANAFASATTLHLRYGWEVGLPAYGIATLVGVGRVQAERHYWRDVAAGAALGMVSGWIFTEAYDSSVQILPWVTSNGAGVNVAFAW
ncbi:phosphatase PAP2 family protein [Vibrio sp. MarTm2]|uniref:phosphatase PAP2 family protein n=1 Tax=Vibrio sp. MarTm2 TaxID=2998831 RepID=UPI0022CD3A27|nr:phosphatase PAP2 family protein [Vibrio sp. MarTm2]MDA0128311.1 phosphatase PAP2 family protein [Vibrio sp. MarTm2]